jgi:hypothetical protein
MNHGEIRKIMKSAVGGGDGALASGENGGTIFSSVEPFTKRR